MRYYTVHAPAGESEARRSASLFVKDGFSWPAFFVPLLWILWHRLWLTLVWYVVFVLVVAWTGRLAGDDVAPSSPFSARCSSRLRRTTSAGCRWKTAAGARSASSFGKDLDEAEARFFATRSGARGRRSTGARRSRARPTPPEHRPAATDEPILGLFPEPEREAR